jgi:hypothetical protein
MLDLGIADVTPLPEVAADPARWAALSARMHRRVFLRSEGTISPVGAPHAVTGKLLATSNELVAKIDRFYAGVAAAYYERPELRAEYLVNPLVEPLLEIERDRPVTTPISRLDAVLGRDGSVRVIEINSVGICMFHMRGLLYLIRELARGGFADDARRLDGVVHDTIADGFVRYANASLAKPRTRLVFGALNPSSWMRAGHRLFRAAFQRHGHDFVFGGPEHVEITDTQLEVRGTPVDVVWGDFLFYIAYQFSRYSETKFPTKLPDYGEAPARAAAIITDARMLAQLRRRDLALISPARSYLALPKSLLSWIHRDDRPVPDRAFLQQHVARTYSARDRADGLVRREDVIANRGDFLVKPCQYGGSHGVDLGKLTDAAAWTAKLDAIWDDPTWVVQVFHEPVTASNKQYVSLGIANLDGVNGGFYFRTAPSLSISARDSLFVPAIKGDGAR